MMENEKTSRLFAIIVILVVSSSALLFSFFGIDRSFWAVECCTVEIADASWSGILENLKTNAHSPPLYYFLLKLWMGLWGTGEAAARGLSAVFYLFSIAAVFFLGKTLYGQKTALLSAFLFMVNPMAIQFAQFTRMYSLLSLLAILSTILFIRQFYSGHASKMNLAAFIAVNVAGSFTHYWFFFLLLAQGITYLWLFSKSSLKSFLLAMLVSVAPFFALWTPVLLVQMANGGTSEFNRPGPYTLLNTLLIFWGGGKKAVLLYFIFVALGFIDLQGLKIKFRNFSETRSFLFHKPALVLFTLLVVSLGVPWTISRFFPIYEESKYPILVLFTVVILVASLLAKFTHRFILFSFCSALFLVVTAEFIRGRTHPPADSPRAVTGYLLERVSPWDVVVFATNSWGPAAYYLKRAGAVGRLTRFVFPAEQAQHPCWTNPGKWLSSQAALEIEAENLVNRIDSALGTGEGKIWLLAGWLPDINEIIKAKMDARFQPVDEKLLGESYSPIRGLIRAYQKKMNLRVDQ